jgi:thioredoxin 1
MKTIFKLFTGMIAILLISCVNSVDTSKLTKLNASEFSEKIKTIENASLIDVRTSDEFKKGHLPNAVNIDWYSNDFIDQLAALDKNAPVFIYCHSGSRSSSAASKMIKEGFTEVYELRGGISEWNSNGYSVVK